MLRWILRRLPTSWLQRFVYETNNVLWDRYEQERIYSASSPTIHYTEEDIAALARMKSEPIPEDDCVFNDPLPESAVRDPTLPLPGTIGWGDETPSIPPPPPPPSPDVDHLFRQREEEEANQKLCHCGCRYTTVACPNCTSPF